jgi:hypothetical protein
MMEVIGLIELIGSMSGSFELMRAEAQVVG